MTALTLLDSAGVIRTVPLAKGTDLSRPTAPLTSRVAYAAAHVIPTRWADNTPGCVADIDWDATLAFRRHLWSWGLGVADAMDTAQRNMGLDTVATRELISRSAAEASSVGGRLVVGVNTDHVDDDNISLDAVIDAYLTQLHFAEDAGAGVVLMASRHLVRAASSAADYDRVYGAVLAHAGSPVILHWLGAAFDPALAGYFGSSDIATASGVLLRIVEENLGRVAGVKMSVLDADAEVALRARLPQPATLYTGDDLNYVGLIEGADGAYSNALLGAFAAVAPSASAAIQALDSGHPADFRRILGPTQDLSRQIFKAPTYFYKTGIAFLSWLNGHQDAFSMVGGLQAARSIPHLSEIMRLANDGGALERPELAAARWTGLLRSNGFVR